MKIKDLILFQELTDAEMEKSIVCSQSVMQTFEKNEYIFYEEDKPSRLYFILEGSVELGQTNSMGRLTNTEHLQEGQAFGEIELFLEQEVHPHYAKAETSVKLLAISRHFFRSTCVRNCAHHNKIIYNMLRLFAKEAEKASQKLQLLTSGTLRQRITRYLLEQSQGSKTITLPMKREELAVYLNTTRPSLSRELSILQTDKIIEITDRTHIKIHDFARLKQEIDGCLN